MNERDSLDGAETNACCPTTAELSKAVSVSLGLDSVSSPLNNMNLCLSGAFVDCDPAGGCAPRGAQTLGAAGNINTEGSRMAPNGSSLREDDFGEVCHGIQQVSCMDLLVSGEMDSAQTMTRDPVISRYVCKESNLFISPMAELPAPSQVDELSSLKQYSAYSANPNLYRDTQSIWCANERAYSGRSEPERGGSGGHNLLCKYCSCGQTHLGPRHECHCLWYRKSEQGGKGAIRTTMAQEYGQVERYQSAVAQGQATFSTIKTEPSVWVDCADRSFR